MRRLFIVSTVLFLIQPHLFSQSVIINEVSQGSDGGKEWVELMVLDNEVDLRGWELGDNDDGIWHSIAEFSSHSDWSQVQAGTIIVIFNSGDVDAAIISAGGEDTLFSDKVVILPINNSSYLMDSGPWGLTAGAFSNSDEDDCPAIRDQNDLIIHDLAVSHPTAAITAPGLGKVKYFTGNTTAGLVDNSMWIEAASTSGTPGAGNGGDNSNWVDSSLPVELSRWAAQVQNGVIRLSWTTESETENQGFILERRHMIRQAEPVEAWKEIASFVTDDGLVGQGSTTNQTDYYYLDKNVQVGETYSYRLTDVDYRGNPTYHNDINVTVKAADANLKPGKMTLLPAYPNPFNPEVELAFTLEKDADAVSLQIYDLHGTLVQTLSTGYHTSGTHSFSWNGMDVNGNTVPSGVYLVRLADQDLARIQRITLIR
ncbi:MAG: T9SS type A sorting domain-containing protein [Candidatus Marinimicrobia bacterium]|nr:T9SS type A sorting domain-containing protein [Candidatus Neomarinimicrobiota bacterium]